MCTHSHLLNPDEGSGFEKLMTPRREKKPFAALVFIVAKPVAGVYQL
jgi:hypothetical protein